MVDAVDSVLRYCSGPRASDAPASDIPVLSFSFVLYNTADGRSTLQYATGCLSSRLTEVPATT